MNENDIREENYSNIIKRMIYTMTYTTFDESKTKIVIDRVNALVRASKENYSKLNKNGLPFNYEMNKSTYMAKIYDLILTMAIGYATEEELYKDSQLLEDIIAALDYMHENYYNRREENIFSSDNWWDWEIGIAKNY